MARRTIRGTRWGGLRSQVLRLPLALLMSLLYASVTCAGVPIQTTAFATNPAGATGGGLQAMITDVRVAQLPRQFENTYHQFESGYDDRPPVLALERTSQSCCEPWTWQILPEGLMYRTYLASVTAPRMGAAFNYEQDSEWVWDLSIGGRIGLFRYGTTDSVFPDGWELDVEAAAFPRLVPEGTSSILEATDYRFGMPLSYGCGPHRFKLAYYHLSSHLGDEFAQLNGLGQRINYVTDSLVFGYSYYPSEPLRLYGEAGYAFSSDIAEQWQLQFGIDYSTLEPTDSNGVPFVAANVHLREEVNYSGNFVLQAGWQWNAAMGGRRLRIGVQYYNGKHEKYQFFDTSEQKVGFGVWYDF